MTAIDSIILVTLLLYLLKGLWRGALPELCSICGLVVGLFLASRFAPGLGNELARLGHIQGSIGTAILFTMLFLIGTFAFALLGFIVGHLPFLSKQVGASRVAGGFFGLGQGVVILALVLQAIMAHGWPTALESAVARGTLAPPFVRLGTAVYRGGEVLSATVR